MRELGRAAIVVLVLTVFLGLAYPALLTGFGQLAFPSQANGSLIERNGVVVGSRLAAQAFASPGYFRERPSAVAYNAAGTGFSDLGPTSPVLAKLVRTRIAAILRLERPYNPGLTARSIPVDAVTASASGIDPEISPAYARLQATRVAAVRHLPLARVLALVRTYTTGRALDLIGDPGVNVLALNLALDRETR